MKLRLVLPIAALQLLIACAGPQATASDPRITLTKLEELPAPMLAPGAIIQPGDKITISVFGAPQLAGDYYVDADGSLNFPLIGKVVVSGQSPSEAAASIAGRLNGRFVKDPQVSVVPSELAVPSVSVGGEVKRPGTYPSRSSATLMRAVNNAGGLTEFAKVQDVLVMRRVDGDQYIGVYNIRAIQRGNYPDPAIYPDDVITVGDSAARRRLNTILQFVPLVSSSVLLLDRVTN